jgi:hypothetical protein
MENYMVGASFSRRYAMKGGTCIFVLNYKKFDTVNLDKYCADFDIELCAVKIKNESSYVYVLSAYRAPSGNFSKFLLQIDEVLKSLYTLKAEFIICGDFNIDYLMDNYRKNQLNSLLNSYNLFSTVDFLTRITNTSKSAIDNIFIDYSRMGKFELSPMYNGISDHDAQVILIHDVTMSAHIKCPRMSRKFDKHSLLNFNYSLSFELWKEVFDENKVNIVFNTFLNIFIRYFYNSFPKSFTRPHTNTKTWITSDIKTKCSIKRYLYLSCKESNNPNTQSYYRTFCKVLSRNIMEAKRLHYDKLIINSKNRTETTWNIVKTLTGRKSYHEAIPNLSVLNKTCNSTKMIAESFNKYFLSIAETIIKITLNNNSDIVDICNKANEYLIHIYKITFPPINYTVRSTIEETDF